MPRLDRDPLSFYEIHVFVCTSERPADHPRPSCGGSGSESLRKWLKKQIQFLGLEKKVRINSAGCMNRCDLGPVMVIYPEAVWYAIRNEDDVREILQTHILDGGRVERLLLDAQS